MLISLRGTRHLLSCRPSEFSRCFIYKIMPLERVPGLVLWVFCRIVVGSSTNHHCPLHRGSPRPCGLGRTKLVPVPRTEHFDDKDFNAIGRVLENDCPLSLLLPDGFWLEVRPRRPILASDSLRKVALASGLSKSPTPA